MLKEQIKFYYSFHFSFKECLLDFSIKITFDMSWSTLLFNRSEVSGHGSSHFDWKNKCFRGLSYRHHYWIIILSLRDTFLWSLQSTETQNDYLALLVNFSIDETLSWSIFIFKGWIGNLLKDGQLCISSRLIYKD